MTEIEVIERLEYLKNKVEIALLTTKSNCSWAKEEVEGTLTALEMAINALEKQIPKKPTIYTNGDDKDRLACCPVCDSNVDWTYEGFWRKGNPKYCGECGQRIDWSE